MFEGKGTCKSGAYLLCLMSGLCPPVLLAQQQATPSHSAGGASRPPQVSDYWPRGSISGSIVDDRQGLVPGALVTLIREGLPDATAVSGADGQFDFPEIPPGKYNLRVAAPGLGSYFSPGLTLVAGEHRKLDRIILPFTSNNASIVVTATRVEIAREQISLQERQRLLGFIPNFYTSYIWNAAPMNVGQKFRLASRSIFDPVVFLTTGIGAGIEQATNGYASYGQGAAGYAKRYGADFGNEVTNRMLSSAIFPSFFHQDPRYFYKGIGSPPSRSFYAISRAVVTRGDDGDLQPNYSRLMGSFSSAAISNTYRGRKDRGIHLVASTGALHLASNAADNLLREFFFRTITSKLPGYQKKPSSPPMPGDARNESSSRAGCSAEDCTAR
jgi:Carboxypeptidase regulatory-like domain